ncbi:sex peptide receptor-like [Stegostoma tigrinum]|uniref:sex peptide receptor-like n=1 Tax=Stegostoma tigrinum TaxID=3053191 RepID=UPI00287045C1|nr:sex peptide receptor-like [Stegostoma tigrinum]
MCLPRQVIAKAYYTFLAVVGVPVSLVVIVFLSWDKCGLSTCTTRYLVAMAVFDLLFIIFDVILIRFTYYYYPRSFLNITAVCSVNNILSNLAIDCSVWFTAAFSFDRFVAICFHQMKTKYCTEKTAMRVLATICIFFSLKNIPNYFRFEPSEIIKNVSWYCYTSYSYYYGRQWASFKYFEKFLTPFFPFTFILFINIMTVRHIFEAIKVRKGLRGQRKTENDPEIESRKKSVILLFALSASFILLWLVYILYFFETGYFLDTDAFYLFEQIAYMLRNLSCCTNAFIYVVTHKNFRDQLKYAVKYPVIKIIQLTNKSK